MLANLYLLSQTNFYGRWQKREALPALVEKWPARTSPLKLGQTKNSPSELVSDGELSS